MSLLDQIGAKTQGRMQEQDEAAAVQAEQEAAPDAVKDYDDSRSAFSGAMSSAPDEPMQEEQPTPEEQELFTKAEKALAQVVYGDKASNSILKAVNGAPDPVEGIGKVSADIIHKMSKKFPQLDEDIMFALGESAVEQITDLVESADSNVNLNEDQMAEALSIGVGVWMDNNKDKVDRDMLQYTSQEPPRQL